MEACVKCLLYVGVMLAVFKGKKIPLVPRSNGSTYVIVQDIRENIHRICRSFFFLSRSELAEEGALSQAVAVFTWQ